MGLSFLHRLRLQLIRKKAKFAKRKFDTTRTEFAASAREAQVRTATVMVSGVRLVFGLEWNPLPSGVSVEASLQEARNAGYIQQSAAGIQ